MKHTGEYCKQGQLYQRQLKAPLLLQRVRHRDLRARIYTVVFCKPPVRLCWYVLFYCVCFKGSSPSSVPELTSSRSTRPPNATGFPPANTLSPCPSSTMPAAASTASSAWVALRLEPTTHMSHRYTNTADIRHSVWTPSWIFVIIDVQASGAVCWRKGKVTKGQMGSKVEGIQTFHWLETGQRGVVGVL